MIYTRKRALCWLYAALMTAAMLVYVLLFTGMRFEMNDDMFILHGLQGFEIGRPASFHIFIHGILVWPLAVLTGLFPNLPWFTYAQLTLMAISAVVFAKSVMQCFVKHERPFWIGVVMATAFLLVLFLEHMARITFTHTATLVGTAAVAQMFSIDHDRGSKKVIIGMVGALVLVAYAYALRQVIILPLLAFCGWSYIIILCEYYGFGKKRKRSVKPMVISLVIIMVAVAGLLIIRECEFDHNGARDYQEWTDANGDILDFYGMYSVPQEAFEQVGWDETKRAMAEEWCFLDPDISTEAFRELTEYMDNLDQRTLRERLRAAWITFFRVVKFSPVEMRCMSLFAISAIIAFVGVCWTGRWRYVAYALPAIMVMLIMLLMLSLTGRLPIRAMFPAVIPAGTIVLCLLPACYPFKKNGLLITCALVCAVISVWCAKDLLLRVPQYDENEPNPAQAMIDLEAYALTEPDALIIYDGTIAGADERVFPTYPDGVPSNITFWGGWGMRSPQNVELFERFGIQLDEFGPETFFREDVFLASATETDEGTKLIENWMEAELGIDVERRLHCQSGAAYIYHFDKPEEAPQ